MIDMIIDVPQDSSDADGYHGELMMLSSEMQNKYPNCKVRVRVTRAYGDKSVFKPSDFEV